ncbi:MAG: hypothetical protein RR914_03515 [Oscillospiraceae bacterium]
MAEFNLNDEQIKKIKDKFGSKNIEQAQMIDKALKEGKSPDFVMKDLNPKQSAALKKILSDKGTLEKLLATEQAKNLLKKLLEEK